jgi:hypothetical protein
VFSVLLKDVLPISEFIGKSVRNSVVSAIRTVQGDVSLSLHVLNRNLEGHLNYDRYIERKTGDTDH